MTGSIAVRIPDPMEPCIQSAAVTSACLICGGRTEKMHRPMFHRLVLPTLLSGLRAQASWGAVAGVIATGHTADPIGRGRRDAMEGRRMGTARR